MTPGFNGVIRQVVSSARICWVAGLWLGTSIGMADSGEVAVVWSRQIPESRTVARYYATRRGIPDAQLIGIDVAAGITISRDDYIQRIERPIKRALEDQGLMKFVSTPIAATATAAGHMAYRCVASRIRYLVMTWGIPYRILDDPTRLNKDLVMSPVMRRTDACVDNELCLLPVLGQVNLTGAMMNRFCYNATNTAALNPTNGVLMVTRLDGPSPAIAKGLVDKAMQAERDGLFGRAYFDLRGIASGDYMLGDQFMTNGYRICRMGGLESVIDNRPEVFPVSFPMSDIAVYAGWYTSNNEGVFSRPEVEFRPGAIAYHLHSYSGEAIRNPNVNWVGPLLERGVTATMGCVAEPFLALTPDVGVYLSRLLAGWTWGEASYSSMEGLSWQTIVLGDPLYRPFGKPPEVMARELEERGNPNFVWALLRLVDLQLNRGIDPQAMIAEIEKRSITTNSSVLQEKLAMLRRAESNDVRAVAHLERAVSLDCSPMQLLRLLLELGDMQAALGRTADAFNSYERAIRDCPRWIDQLDIRRKQLPLARKLRKRMEVEFYEREIKRLEKK
ncbi:MAG: TIGR03790 family protein [Pedosphaera sp.]|nr:TIGR03790 family protein [Pedosphaera sp.]